MKGQQQRAAYLRVKEALDPHLVYPLPDADDTCLYGWFGTQLVEQRVQYFQKGVKQAKLRGLHPDKGGDVKLCQEVETFVSAMTSTNDVHLIEYACWQTELQFRKWFLYAEAMRRVKIVNRMNHESRQELEAEVQALREQQRQEANTQMRLNDQRILAATNVQVLKKYNKILQTEYDEVAQKVAVMTNQQVTLREGIQALQKKCDGLEQELGREQRLSCHIGEQMKGLKRQRDDIVAKDEAERGQRLQNHQDEINGVDQHRVHGDLSINESGVKTYWTSLQALALFLADIKKESFSNDGVLHFWENLVANRLQGVNSMLKCRALKTQKASPSFPEYTKMFQTRMKEDCEEAPMHPFPHAKARSVCLPITGVMRMIAKFPAKTFPVASELREHINLIVRGLLSSNSKAAFAHRLYSHRLVANDDLFRYVLQAFCGTDANPEFHKAAIEKMSKCMGICKDGLPCGKTAGSGLLYCSHHRNTGVLLPEL